MAVDSGAPGDNGDGEDDDVTEAGNFEDEVMSATGMLEASYAEGSIDVRVRAAAYDSVVGPIYVDFIHRPSNLRLTADLSLSDVDELVSSLRRAAENVEEWRDDNSETWAEYQEANDGAD